MILYLLRISQAHIRLYLPQTIRNPKDAIDQCPISRPLDFEVSEQSVRPEKRYGLVQDIIVFAIRVNIEVACDR